MLLRFLLIHDILMLWINFSPGAKIASMLDLNCGYTTPILPWSGWSGEAGILGIRNYETKLKVAALNIKMNPPTNFKAYKICKFLNPSSEETFIFSLTCSISFQTTYVGFSRSLELQILYYTSIYFCQTLPSPFTIEKCQSDP